MRVQPVDTCSWMLICLNTAIYVYMINIKFMPLYIYIYNMYIEIKIPLQICENLRNTIIITHNMIRNTHYNVNSNIWNGISNDPV